MGTKVYIYIYSGAPLNRHSSTADTHDIMDNSESPDCHPFTLLLKQLLNSGHLATPYNGQQIHSTYCMFLLLYTVELLYNGHHWNQHFVHYSGCPASGRHGMVNLAVELHFQTLDTEYITLSCFKDYLWTY